MNELLEKEHYPISSKNRGIGIVIVNIFKKHPDYYRDGAGHEIEKLCELFKLMGLEVRQYQELTRDKIVKLLKEVSVEARLKTDSMIAIAISSHGCEEGLLGINVESRHEWDGLDKGPYEGKDDCISPAEIRKLFNGDNSPFLAKKPKILLLNGCRGGDREDIVRSDNVSTKELPKQRATTWSDFFVVNSCQPGTISLRSDRVGSLFIDEFLKSYKEYGSQLPLELLLPVVNRNLIDTCARKVRDAMQSCNWESSCTSFLKVVPINFKPLIKQPTIQQPTIAADNLTLVWATASKGVQGPNEMSAPHGLAVTPYGQIYITDPSAQCIWVYSTEGEALFQDIKPKEYKQLVIENLGLKFAWGICVFENFIFVSCSLAITKFSLLAGGLITHKIHPVPLSGMDIDKDGTIYVCERQTCNIMLLDLLLNVKSKLNLTPTLDPARDRLMDIKLLGEEMYLLINHNDYTVQIFNLNGIHLRNLVTKEDLCESLFFTINRTNKCIYAGDLITNELKAFDENGKLMYRTGKHGNERGNISHPNGIDLTSEGEVVVVCSLKAKFMLQSFQVPPAM